MSVTVAPVFSDVYTALVSFIQGALGTSVPVIQGLGNRVPMPGVSPGFVAITLLGERRLSYTIDSWDMSAGSPTTGTAEQKIEVAIQMDFYGPSSGDWAATISTLFRDDYGVQALAPTCAPLYADDARMIPLINAEDQYEQRWSLDARLQYNPVVTVSAAFADATSITPISVTEAYPP